MHARGLIGLLPTGIAAYLKLIEYCQYAMSQTILEDTFNIDRVTSALQNI